MIVQKRAQTLRIIAQHDHGLLSGHLAASWLRASGEKLGFELVLAAGMHDLGWQSADARPIFDPSTGGPADFVAYPQEDRAALYTRALDDMARISPLTALLTSLHYQMMLGSKAPPTFLANEDARRAWLRGSGLIELDDDGVKEALAILQFFDVLSLYICMSAPGAVSDNLPRWLDPAVFAKDVDGRRYTISWQDEGLIHLHPFPFEGPITARLPYMTLDKVSYRSPEALLSAWSRARRGVWTLTVAAKETG